MIHTEKVSEAEAVAAMQATTLAARFVESDLGKIQRIAIFVELSICWENGQGYFLLEGEKCTLK